MRIGVIGVGRSRNVGDQLIAASIQKTVSSLSSDHVVSLYDFDHGEFQLDNVSTPARKKSTRSARRAAPRLYWPRAIKNIFNFILQREKRARLSQFIAANDVIFVGGGHLFIDNFLYFPLHIWLAAKIARDKPLYFWCIGSSTHKSWLCRLILKSATRGRLVYTRDSQSTANLITQKICSPDQVKTLCDPALFCDELPLTYSRSSPDVIGLAIMDPVEAHRHSTLRIDREEASRFWVSLAELLSRSARVRILNNGNPSDQYFIESYVAPRLPKEVEVCKQVSDYREMLTNTRECAAVISQRLHATIPCIAFSIPFLAIEWDKKLSSILTDLGLADHLVSFEDSPDQVVALLYYKTGLEDICPVRSNWRKKYNDFLLNIL